jgi:hypothetical protein
VYNWKLWANQRRRTTSLLVIKGKLVSVRFEKGLFVNEHTHDAYIFDHVVMRNKRKPLPSLTSSLSWQRVETTTTTFSNYQTH